MSKRPGSPLIKPGKKATGERTHRAAMIRNELRQIEQDTHVVHPSRMQVDEDPHQAEVAHIAHEIGAQEDARKRAYAEEKEKQRKRNKQEDKARILRRAQITSEIFAEVYHGFTLLDPAQVDLDHFNFDAVAVSRETLAKMLSYSAAELPRNLLLSSALAFFLRDEPNALVLNGAVKYLPELDVFANIEELIRVGKIKQSDNLIFFVPHNTRVLSCVINPGKKYAFINDSLFSQTPIDDIGEIAEGKFLSMLGNVQDRMKTITQDDDFDLDYNLFPYRVIQKHWGMIGAELLINAIIDFYYDYETGTHDINKINEKTSYILGESIAASDIEEFIENVQEIFNIADEAKRLELQKRIVTAAAIQSNLEKQSALYQETHQERDPTLKLLLQKICDMKDNVQLTINDNVIASAGIALYFLNEQDRRIARFKAQTDICPNFEIDETVEANYFDFKDLVQSQPDAIIIENIVGKLSEFIETQKKQNPRGEFVIDDEAVRRAYGEIESAVVSAPAFDKDDDIFATPAAVSEHASASQAQNSPDSRTI